MKEILETIILNLVDNKDVVEIKEVDGEKWIIFGVIVAETDMGRVIGRQGKVANSIRTVMKALGSRDRKRVNIEFLD